MYSDNGRNFLACHNILKEFKIQLQERLESSDLKQFLSASIIDWHFIPPYSPHFGGIWEANVKSVKRHLYRTFNGVVLTVEEMNTILCQIESILNSRPLIPISTTDIDEPLTPHHLLTGYNHSAHFEPRELCPTTLHRNLTSSTLKISLIHFGKNGGPSISTHCSKNRSGFAKENLPEINDIVLIRRPFDPPRSWHYGKVVKIFPGSDGEVRVVDVATSKGTQRESSRNLIPLTVDTDLSTGEYVVISIKAVSRAIPQLNWFGCTDV